MNFSTLFVIAFSDMGLNPFIVSLIAFFGLFFLISFALTSPNMDTKGLLRVLYAKPVRKADGTVEYPDKEK